MARIWKQVGFKRIQPGSKIITVKGVPHVRYQRRNGDTVLARVAEKGGGQFCLVPSLVYSVRYRNADGILKTVKGYTDKPATDQLAARLERKAARKQEGMVDPCDEHMRRPLLEHLADYRRELEARNNSPDYIDTTISRLTTLLDGCGFRFIMDLNGSASRVMNWLADLRKKGRRRVPLEEGKELYTPREAAAVLGIKPASVGVRVKRLRLEVVGVSRARRFPRATMEALQDRLCRGRSVATSNYYLSHLISFCNWLVEDDRMTKNPFTHLEGGDEQVDRRHDRRELTGEELCRLLDSTEASRRSFLGLSGRDRFALYATACGTGFRARGLGSLIPESFALDDDPPTCTLAARNNKNRKPQVQPLPPDLAELLRDYLRDKPTGQPVWGGNWARHRRGAEMLRRDLEAVGIPYVKDGPDGPLFADFHSLRHSFLTALGRAGVELGTAQDLAGHSSPLLTKRYTHSNLPHLAGAVAKLPPFLPDRPDKSEALRATGTEGNQPRQYVAKDVARNVATACADRDTVSIGLHPDDATELSTACHKSLEKKPIGASLQQSAAVCMRVGEGTRTPDNQIHSLEL